MWGPTSRCAPHSPSCDPNLGQQVPRPRGRAHTGFQSHKKSVSSTAPQRQGGYPRTHTRDTHRPHTRYIHDHTHITSTRSITQTYKRYNTHQIHMLHTQTLGLSSHPLCCPFLQCLCSEGREGLIRVSKDKAWQGAPMASPQRPEQDASSKLAGFEGSGRPELLVNCQETFVSD